MNTNFWQKLNKPFYALAPLAGVGDMAFRQMCKKYGADVVYSEMASVAALKYSPKKTLELVRFAEKEAPYVVQLFGSIPEQYSHATKIITELVKPDGIDINFGCPVPKVAKQNSGAALFKNMELSHEIIKATVESTDLPVSIKTRTRAGDTELLRFLDRMSDLDIKTIMIHGRTLNQGFSGEIDFEIIKKARDYFGGIIIANGGIVDRESAHQTLEKTEADGLGIARGAFGRPWIFSQLKNENYICPEIEEIFDIMREHAELYVDFIEEDKLNEMRKHFAWYVQGFPGAKALREKLLLVERMSDLNSLLK